MEFVLAPDSLALIVQDVPKRIEGFINGKNEVFKDVLEQKCKDGTTVWTEVHARYIRNEKTGHIEALGTSRNISEIRRANINLKQSEAKVKAIIEGTSNSIWAFDRDYRIV